MQTYQQIVKEITLDERNFTASKGGNIDEKNPDRIIGRCVARGRDGVFAVLNNHGLLVSVECPVIGGSNVCTLSDQTCANGVKTVLPKIPKDVIV